MIQLKLEYPIKRIIKGSLFMESTEVTINTVNIRRPSFGDFKDLDFNPGPKLNENFGILITRLCSLNQSEVNQLDIRDYSAISEKVNYMINGGR